MHAAAGPRRRTKHQFTASTGATSRRARKRSGWSSRPALPGRRSAAAQASNTASLDRVDRAVLHRGDDVPAGPRGDHLGRLRVERQVRVGQDDDLGVALDDAFGADPARVAGQVGKDVGAAGEVDQLPVEPVRPGRKRLVRLATRRAPRTRAAAARRRRRLTTASRRPACPRRWPRQRRGCRTADRACGWSARWRRSPSGTASPPACPGAQLRDDLVGLGQRQDQVRLQSDDGLDRRVGIGAQPRLDVLRFRRIVGVRVDGDERVAVAQREGDLGQAPDSG